MEKSHLLWWLPMPTPTKYSNQSNIANELQSSDNSLFAPLLLQVKIDRALQLAHLTFSCFLQAKSQHNHSI